MKGEQDLLFQVLDEAIPVQEVQAWLDDAFEVSIRTSYRSLVRQDY